MAKISLKQAPGIYYKSSTMNNKSNRRNFIKNAAIGTAATLSIPQIVSAALATESIKKISFEKDG